MTTAYVATGTIADGKSIELDEPLPLQTGKVRVTVEAQESVPPKQSLQEWLEDLRKRQASRGVTQRTGYSSGVKRITK